MSGTITYSITSENQLNADIAAISIGGAASAANTSYVFQIAADLALNANIAPIALAAGDTLSIQGANTDNPNLLATIDGGGSRGFIVNSGTVTFSTLTLTAMTAPGGAGGVPGGGGAVYVGAGATVSASNVTFNGDTATGGTAAGGAVFVASGGSFSMTGGVIGGAGKAAGTGVFIQGSGGVTLTNTSVTGGVADQTGSNLGSGVGSVVTQGSVTLAGPGSYTGGTTVNGTLTLAGANAAGSGAITVNGTLALTAPNAAGNAPIVFGAVTGDTLTVGAGDTPAGTISGFIPNGGIGSIASDVIDLQGIGMATGYTLAAGNHLTLLGLATPVTLNLDPTVSYVGDSFILRADAVGGTQLSVAQTAFLADSETALNAVLAQIDLGGKSAGPNAAYTIVLTAGFTLSSDLSAINLGTGSTVTIDGGGYAIDGAGIYRGFFDYAGGLTLENLTIQNAVAAGGAGGTGATPGGGGAGLGGGLFVGSAGSATLSNVTFLNDSAVGGAGGTAGTAGTGGGGGLGGAGGSASAGTHNALDGGGGGIGVSAFGGSGSGGTAATAGGPGIVPGVASGGGNSGYTLITHTVGSGRGGGGSRTIYTPEPAATGGLSGFGGGAASGKAAGFGGGGAQTAGGWGGGGSGVGNAGGFGAGAGVAGGAGGGLGAGGAIFVQQGGALTITDGSLSGGGVAGGTGATAGLALGAGIFGQGGTITLAPAAGQTVTIADAIADPGAVGGAGATTVAVSGSGGVTLAGNNSFTGGLVLAGGDLTLTNPGAAGVGLIIFSYGSRNTLVLGPGDIPANAISGFLPGDVIDLQGIGLATGVVPGSGHVLTLTGAVVPVQLSIDPAQDLTGESFSVADDGAGGTLLTATTIAGDQPPAIAGVGTVSGDDHTPFNPFTLVTLSDLDDGQTETLTLTSAAPADGVLSNLGGGSYDAATGVYTISGSTSDVTAALQALVFTPTVNQVAPGQIETTAFTLTATDGLMNAITRTQTVNITALNDAPVISGLNGALVEGYWNVAFSPLAAATITDPDVGAAETVTFRLADSGQGPGGATDGNGVLSLSMPGVTLTHTGIGTYSLTAASPAAVTAAVQALQFTAVPHPSVPGYTITYVNMTVTDGIAPPVSSGVEVLTGLPIFTGLATTQTTTAGQQVSPFTTAAVSDSAGLTIQGFSLVLYDSSTDYLHPTDANGVLSGPDLTKVGIGTYVLTPGSTAAVTAELEALTFTPANSNGTVTTNIELSAFDGATTADTGISITALPGPPIPGISGTVSGQSIMDNTAITPFAAVVVSDANAAPLDTATITLLDGYSGIPTDANGTLSGAGLSQTGIGTYTLSATDPATLTQALDALVFTPTLNEVPPGSLAMTDFTLVVADANGSATDTATSVYASPSAVAPLITGALAGQSVAMGTTVLPFATTTISDANPVPVDAVTITLTDAGSGLVTDANGVLSGSGLTQTDVGTYVLAAGDPAAITAALDALVFTPTNNLDTTVFTIAAADGLAVAIDASTDVTTVDTLPPTITIAPIANGNTVNAAAALSGFTIAGTTTGVEDGQSATILIFDGGFNVVAAYAATVVNGMWSVDVTPAQAQMLADGTCTVTADVTNLGGAAANEAVDLVNVDLAGIVAATPGLSVAALDFGAVRVGAPAVTRSFALSNGAVPYVDQASLAYDLTPLPAPFSSASLTGTLASGASVPVTMVMATGVSGDYSGTTLSVGLSSLGGGSTGLPDVALPGATVGLSGKVYAPAVAQLATSAINFGVVHVGDIATASLTIANAATGALSDVLTGGVSKVTGAFSAISTLGAGVAAGGSGALIFGLTTAATGVFNGSAALSLASHDASLADIAITAAPITLTGTVDAYAVAAWEKVSGTGTLTQNGTAYTLNLGTFVAGAATPTVTLGVLNAATGLADLLSGGFSVLGSGAFANTGLTAFSGLAAGKADTVPTVKMSTTAPGTFSETITLLASGSNASGYAGALTPETLTITGTVLPSVYTLTPGADTIAGGTLNDTIVATAGALSTGDVINGGGGVNTLALTGGGAFNLALPATLSNIQIVTAQEGQGATAQTVTLRAGLNTTVDVGADPASDPAPGITIIGASNNAVINLGGGSDTVVLGAGEIVNGGSGNATFIVTAATIKATINGGAGANTLVVNGGGAVTMGTGIRGMTAVSLAATTNFTANGTAGLVISGSAAGGDTITLGAATQAVASSAANETIKASSAFAGAQVSALGTNSLLEITSAGTVTLHAATAVGTVKLDAASMLNLNGMAFITATGSNGADTISAGGASQTLTGGAGVDTLIGSTAGSDVFRDTVFGLNGDTIKGFVATDAIDLTNLAFAGAKLSAAASGANTTVTVTSGGSKAVFTMTGSFSATGFHLASDGGAGTLISHI